MTAPAAARSLSLVLVIAGGVCLAVILTALFVLRRLGVLHRARSARAAT